MWWRAALAVAAGCGRIAFDPAGDASGSGDTTTAPTSYREAVLADQPLSYWRLADSGTTARDELGRHPGAYSGACARAAAALILDPDPAVGFDGSTCQILLSDQLPTFVGNAPYSLELWASLSNVATYQIYFMHQARNATDPVDGYAMVNNPGGTYFERVKNQANAANVAAQVVPDRTYHLVGVYDGSSILMYVDGVLAAPAVPDAAAMRGYTAQSFIGASSMATLFVGGRMDEVALYDHALAAERIALHHDIGRNGP